MDLLAHLVIILSIVSKVKILYGDTVLLVSKFTRFSVLVSRECVQID